MCSTWCYHPLRFAHQRFARSGLPAAATMILTAALAVNVAATRAELLDGANLITNGDAEAGSGSSDGYTVVVVPSWNTTGNFTVVPYAVGGGFPTATSPGPADRGQNFFAGGPNNAASSASQSIDLAGYSTPIDSGAVAFTLSGYLGGYATQGDHAVLTVTFRAGDSTVLASTAIGPVTSAERENVTGLLERTQTGIVPIGTRTANLELAMTRQAGSYNDGYADNLSLTLSTSPTVCRGDADCDGDVDFADIDPFVAKLGCPTSGPNCDAPCTWMNADVDGDGDVDFADIDPFVARLGAVCR